MAWKNWKKDRTQPGTPLNDEEDGVYAINDDSFNDSNLDIYTHMNRILGILETILPNAIMKNNLTEGLTAYSLTVEQLEIFAKASMVLKQEYDDKIKLYRESEEYKTIQENYKMIKMAHYKLGLILSEIAYKQPSTEPLRA